MYGDGLFGVDHSHGHDDFSGGIDAGQTHGWNPLSEISGIGHGLFVDVAATTLFGVPEVVDVPLFEQPLWEAPTTFIPGLAVEDDGYFQVAAAATATQQPEEEVLWRQDGNRPCPQCRTYGQPFTVCPGCLTFQYQ